MRESVNRLSAPRSLVNLSDPTQNSNDKKKDVPTLTINLAQDDKDKIDFSNDQELLEYFKRKKNDKEAAMDDVDLSVFGLSLKSVIPKGDPKVTMPRLYIKQGSYPVSLETIVDS